MKFKDRLTIFIIGAFLGAIIVTMIKSQRAQDKPVVVEPRTAVEIQRAAAPGVLQAYRDRGVPMESDFIKARKLYAHPDEDKYYRVLILQGQDPEQTLRIEETVTKSPQGERVGAVRVMSADRVIVQWRAGGASSELARALKPWGYRLDDRGECAGEYILTLGEKRPETVAEAVERIANIDGVVSVEPLYYDR